MKGALSIVYPKNGNTTERAKPKSIPTGTYIDSIDLIICIRNS